MDAGPQVPPERSLPPGQHLRVSAPVMHYGPLPREHRQPWTFTVGGATAAGHEQVFTMADLARLGQVSEVADMHCATHWSVLDQRWGGIRAAEVVELAPPDPVVRWVLVFAEFGYAANVRLDDLTAPHTLLATTSGGRPLTRERGAPMRLVIPQLYTWKGPKWVRGWNYLTADDEDRGFWEHRGYHLRGDAWLEQRYGYQ